MKISKNHRIRTFLRNGRLRVKHFSRYTISAFVAGLLLGVPIGYSLNPYENFEQIIIDEENFQTAEDQFLNYEKTKVENEIILKTIVF